MVFGGVRIPHKVLGLDRTMALHDRRVAAYLKTHASEFDVVHCWPGASLHTPKVAAAKGLPALREVPNTHTGNAYEVVAQSVPRSWDRAAAQSLPPDEHRAPGEGRGGSTRSAIGCSCRPTPCA